MTASPVIEWRAATTPFGVITAQALVGTGYGGAIPVGSASSVVALRLYNNFLNVSGVADALNCVLASYDDAVHQGQAVTPQVLGLYCQVEVVDYNTTNTTGADAAYYAIGGLSKHPVPVNSGTLSGTPSSGNGNYIDINLQVMIPPGATQGIVTQGLWVEYSSTS